MTEDKDLILVIGLAADRLAEAMRTLLPHLDRNRQVNEAVLRMEEAGLWLMGARIAIDALSGQGPEKGAKKPAPKKKTKKDWMQLLKELDGDKLPKA